MIEIEKVEVVAHLVRDKSNHRHCAVRLHVDPSCYDTSTESLPLMTVAQCERIVAQLEAKIEELRKDPEGWKLVPIEPTKQMAKVNTWDMNRFYPADEIWKKMLSISPKHSSRKKARKNMTEAFKKAQLSHDNASPNEGQVHYLETAEGVNWLYGEAMELIHGRDVKISGSVVVISGQLHEKIERHVIARLGEDGEHALGQLITEAVTDRHTKRSAQLLIGNGALEQLVEMASELIKPFVSLRLEELREQNEGYQEHLSSLDQ